MPEARDILCCKCGCLKTVSDGIVQGLERPFFKLGGVVGRHPWKTIGLSVLVCTLMGLGQIQWNEEGSYLKNFLPRGSRIVAEHEWISANFPGARVESLIIEDENVLSAQSINAIYDVYETALNIQVASGSNTTNVIDFCVRAGPSCQISSILELWLYNGDVIRNLTDDDVLNIVNQDNIISPLHSREIDPEKYLGHTIKDEQGNITGAKATLMVYLLDGNKTMEHVAMDWEEQLITFVNDGGHGNLSNIYVYAGRTYEDEAMGTLRNDTKLLLCGFCLVFLYLTVSIGQLSLVHHRIFCGLAGLLSIGMALSFTYGFGFAVGLMFGPIHPVLPFLLLGIGVDDIFVVVESLNNLTPGERTLPVDIRMALTLKNAGVSITVTSITDVVAFAIGSTTVIPSLSSFCIYAAIGVLILYILQATFFVACLALDERRRDTGRDACVLCHSHRNTYKPNVFYTVSLQHNVMENWVGPALIKLPVKVVAILMFIGLTSVNVWSFLQVKFDYIPDKYLAMDSYSTKFVEADRLFFPDRGPHVQLFCGQIDYYSNMDTLLQLFEEVQNNPTVKNSTADFWLASYRRWLNSTTERWLKYIEENDIESSILIDEMLDLDDTDSANELLQLPPNVSLDSPYVLVNASSSSSETNNVSRNVLVSTKGSAQRPDKSTSSFQTTINPYGAVDISPASNSSFDNTSFPPSGISDEGNYKLASSVCQFLQTAQGIVYERDVRVDCRGDTAKITGSVFTFNHVKCHSSACAIGAMNDIRAILDDLQLSNGGSCFAYSDPQYMYNETNDVLKVELYRNLALAALSVFIVTLVLITNIWTSLLVFLCVVCTVIDVAGTMYFWDISVDTASSVILILCFGLAVDYSAHIGHSFMTSRGSKNERLKKTLVSIGPAVFSGGISTFLAFSLLYFTKSYGFVIFFRIFTSVVLFGLFHGLVVLPVILSVLGPPPYETSIRLKPSMHTATASAMLPKCNGQQPPGNGQVTIEMEGPSFLPECDDSVFCNGNIWRSMSDIDLDTASKKSPKSPRYSGSYYEQLSNGSWEEIPFPGKQ